MHTFRKEGITLNAVQMYCEVTCVGSFKVPSTPPTTNKTVRFPNDVVDAVESAIQGKDCTFSAFVIAAVRAALEDLQQEETQ